MKENLPQPDMIGPAGRAWRHNLEKSRLYVESVREPLSECHVDAGVVSWIIEARDAHPFWHSYVLHLIHMRHIPGLRDPIAYRPGATHEIVLFALNPNKPRHIDQPLHWLSPANFGAQFIADSDEAAAARIADTVLEIVNGTLNPDTDHMQSWIMRFGDYMVKGDTARAGETKIITKQGDAVVEELVIDPQQPKPPHS